MMAPRCPKYCKLFLCVVVVLNVYKLVVVLYESNATAQSKSEFSSRSSSSENALYSKQRKLHSSKATASYPWWVFEPQVPPIRDSSGKYIVQSFLWKGEKWPSLTQMKPSASLATHCTPEKLYNIAIMSKYWDGFISVSVFALGTDSKVANSMIEFMRNCYTKVRERVSFHIVFEIPLPPLEGVGPFKKGNLTDLRCDNPVTANKFFIDNEGSGKRYFDGKKYPQNLMRNVARNAIPSTHCITVDADMIPSKDLFQELEVFLGSNPVCRSCTYILPVYEVSEEVPQFPPRIKEELLNLIHKNLSRRFHIEVYDKNQANSHLKKWEGGSENPNSFNGSIPIKVMYNITTYEEYWEPIMVLPVSAPQFEERFIGYGFTRSSQTYLLHKLGYKFSVLDEGFFVHHGFQSRNYPEFRTLEIQGNKEKYQVYRRELAARFGTDKKTSHNIHSVKRGVKLKPK